MLLREIRKELGAGPVRRGGESAPYDRRQRVLSWRAGDRRRAACIDADRDGGSESEWPGAAAWDAPCGVWLLLAPPGVLTHHTLKRQTVHDRDPSQPRLLHIAQRAGGLTPRAAVRETKSPAGEHGLHGPGVDDDTNINAMLDAPVLVNRPIVCSPKGFQLCRSSEAVLDLLDTLPPGPLHKEYGALLIDAEGRRVG